MKSSFFFVDQIKLWKKSRYIGILVFFVISLTSINNYFFYQTIKKSEWASIYSTINLLKQYSLSCMELTSDDVDKCTKQTKLFASKDPGNYYGHSVFIDNVLISDTRKYKKDRDLFKVSDSLNAIKVSVEVSKSSIPDLFDSVRKSVTLSIEDVYEKIKNGDDIGGFFLNTLKGRSQHFLAFLSLVILVGWLMKKSILSQMQVIDRLEKIEAEELYFLEKENDKDVSP